MKKRSMESQPLRLGAIVLSQGRYQQPMGNGVGSLLHNAIA
ncbi:hypothetical protein [Brevibacillus brevis]|nr:hypothetical protein [Brevibacillus brevis]